MNTKHIKFLLLILGLYGCGYTDRPVKFTNQQIVCFGETGDTIFQTDRINEVWAPGGFFSKTYSWKIWYDSPTERVGPLKGKSPMDRFPLAKYVVITGTCILTEGS